MAPQNGHTMPAADLRRRVRRITAATVGVAALAASALTVNLAWATDDPAASSTSATDNNQSATTSEGGTTRAPAAPEQDDADGDDEGQTPAAQPGITTPSSPLAASGQVPQAGSGRSHTQSGGS